MLANRVGSATALAVAASLCFACAAWTSGRAVDDASALASRAEAYWKRREAKDLQGAYAFYCDEYRKRVPLAEFLRLTRLTRFDIRDTRVAPVAEASDRVQVTVFFTFLMPSISPKPIESHATTWWARGADRQWCKEDEPFFPPIPKGPSPSTSSGG
jgi:hypothetical protein